MEAIVNFFSLLDYHTYWGVFLFGLLISTTAMCSGIDGAVFWAPVFLFVYKVEPAVAIACAIFIEVFGFGSGVYGYAKQKKIQYKQAFSLLLYAVPIGILGAYVSKLLPEKIMVLMMGLSCIYIVLVNLRRAKLHIEERNTDDLALRHKKLGKFLSMIGGFFVGTIGVGIGETNHYYLLIKNRFPTTYAVGTSVFMIALTAFFCSVFNLIYFASRASFDWLKIASILIFAIPSVTVGARLGVRLAHSIERHHFNYLLAGIFSFMFVISIFRVIS